MVEMRGVEPLSYTRSPASYSVISSRFHSPWTPLAAKVFVTEVTAWSFGEPTRTVRRTR